MFKKKILMVGPFPPTVGGITTCMQNILNSQLKIHFNFILFTTTRPTIGITKNVYDYSLIFKIGLKHLVKSVLITLVHIIRFPIDLLITNAEIIHIHTTDYLPFWECSIYVVLSKCFSRKVVFHVHATTFEIFYNKSNSFIKTFIIKILMLVDKIIILSIEQKAFFKKLVSENKLLVISNVTDFKKYHKIICKSYELDIVKILFVGGEEAKRKGIYDIIKAIPIVVNKYEKNISFIFMGRYDVEKLKQFSIKKNVEKYVKFIGYVGEQDKIEIMKSSDIFLLPSYAEGLPITMLEAMAAGLPIITTPVGSIPEVIIEDVNGYLINPGDYISLANRILILALNYELRKKIGENNKEKIKIKYDLDVMINKMGELYNEI